jgi:hypothetical protein
MSWFSMLAGGCCDCVVGVVGLLEGSNNLLARELPKPNPKPFFIDCPIDIVGVVEIEVDIFGDPCIIGPV